MSEWINCKDGYPEEGVPVLTYNQRDGNFSVDYIILFENPDGIHKIWARRMEDYFECVTCWMPIPTPPKEEDERVD